MSTGPSDRDRTRLKDLAKLAGEGAGPSRAPSPAEQAAPEREENSGVVDLAALMASVRASPPRSTRSSAPAGTAPPPIADGRTTKSAATTRSPRANRRWLRVVGLLAAAAAGAAATQVFGQPHEAGGPTRPAAIALGTTSAGSPPAEPSATPSATRASMAPLVFEVDPASLPVARLAAGPNASSTPPPPMPAANPLRTTSAAVSKAAAQTAPTSKAIEAPPAAAQLPPPASAGAADQTLQAAMQQAVEPTSSSAAKGAASAGPNDTPDVAPRSLPDRPGLRAVEGALRNALPDARACLGPDDPISHATVTFRSDGRPQSVSVSGGAKGKPAEACIRAALMRARVDPFLQETFSAAVTIRPN